jgi:hypothetical protein
MTAGPLQPEPSALVQAATLRAAFPRDLATAETERRRSGRLPGRGGFLARQRSSERTGSGRVPALCSTRRQAPRR